MYVVKMGVGKSVMARKTKNVLMSFKNSKDSPHKMFVVSTLAIKSVFIEVNTSFFFLSFELRL